MCGSARGAAALPASLASYAGVGLLGRVGQWGGRVGVGWRLLLRVPTPPSPRVTTPAYPLP